MTSPEFGQGGISTIGFYEDASGLRSIIHGDDISDIEQTKLKLRDYLRNVNNNSGLIGCEIKIRSDQHHIDWSHGEATENNGVVGLEMACGIFEGKFIGYIILPTTDCNSGQEEPGLATVMDTTIYDHDIGFMQVLVVTPVFSSDIEFM
jgi:hypothetical protein